MKIWYESKLSTTHPDLQKVFRAACSKLPFDVQVVETDRSAQQAAANLKSGKSQTTRSRHVKSNNECKMACAIDAAPRLANGTIPWKRLDLFQAINKAMMDAAAELKIPIEWGGNWKTFKDMDHWQLPWKQYP